MGAIKHTSVTIQVLGNCLLVKIPNENNPSKGPYVYPARSNILSMILLSFNTLNTIIQSKNRIVKQKWTEISVIDSSEKLIKYFRENNLSPIAEAIQETLTINLEKEPSGEMHYWLQAKAIKNGIIEAYNKNKEY